MVNQGTPIYVGTTIIGRVRGDTFYKRIHKGHYLLKPFSVAFDVQSILDAQKAGAVNVNVRDMDSGKTFVATIQTILDKGLRFNRGHGNQIALVMKEWTEEGALPVEVKAEVKELFST
jgi:hypothetical protein